MPVRSPFLQSLWQTVLLKYRWTTKDLQRESGLSYNYVRHIVDGKVIPARNALRQMCEAVGLDFERVWASLNSIDGWSHGDEHERQVGGEIGASLIFKESPQNIATQSRMVPELIAIFERLPIAAQYQLMAEACHLAAQHDVSVPGVINPFRAHEGPIVL